MRLRDLTAPLLLSLLGACASAAHEDPDASAGSVRARLAAPTPTTFAAAPATSGGALTARRWSQDGWLSGDVALVIDHGSIDARTDDHGDLVISALELGLAPIDLPTKALGFAARLEHLQLDLEHGPAIAAASWSTEDAATAATQVQLQLSWAIAIDGASSELGPQHLPPIPVDVTVSGDPSAIDATFTFDLPGTVWEWASIVELQDLRLVVDSTD